MWRITQNGDRWVVTRAGVQVGDAASYDEALATLAQAAVADLAPAEGGDGQAGMRGLLPEAWRIPVACLNAPTGPYRDFTDCVWSWRDPTVGFVPLMLQTETEMGHFGAELAGFVERIEANQGSGPAMFGRFYDSDAGVQFRDMLLDGRRFGVSVDPSENVEAEFVCTEQDEDGFCVDGADRFLAYEISGVTGMPFPGFAEVYIELDPDATTAGEMPAPVAASAAPVAPPAAWFADPGFDGPVPLTIDADGRVYGHVATWGTCHTGRASECLTPPTSSTGYAYFRTGEVLCQDGTRVPTGTLTVGADHAPLSANAAAAADHYANVALAWADVAAGEDDHGIWVAGALRPGVDETLLRVLRASSLSGDWRPIRGRLEMVAALAVNVPGYPIPRVAGAAPEVVPVELPAATARRHGADVVALVASNAVVPDGAGRATRRPCGSCSDNDDRLARIERTVAALYRETRRPAVEALRARLARPAPDPVAELRARLARRP